MLKKIAIGIVVLLVIIAGAAYFLFSNLDSIIKAAIEKYGTAATQTEVKLDSVKIGLTSGEGALNGLSVANPKGFASAKALYLGLVSIKLDTSSITGGGPIVIREIVIEKPQVTYELANDGGSNLQTIQKNTVAYAGVSGSGGNAGGGTAGSGGGAGSASNTSAQERKVIINDLYIRDGQIGISQALLQGKTFSAGLPTIHLTNIGKDKGGASPAQVAEQVLGSITSTASKVATAELTKQLGSVKGLTGGAGSGASDQLKGLLGR
jgi:hypothetical protein